MFEFAMIVLGALILLVLVAAVLWHPSVRGQVTTPGVVIRTEKSDFSDPNRISYVTGSGRSASAVILRKDGKYLVLQRCAFPRREFRRIV